MFWRHSTARLSTPSSIRVFPSKRLTLEGSTNVRARTTLIWPESLHFQHKVIALFTKSTPKCVFRGNSSWLFLPRLGVGLDLTITTCATNKQPRCHVGPMDGAWCKSSRTILHLSWLQALSPLSLEVLQRGKREGSDQIIHVWNSVLT